MELIRGRHNLRARHRGCVATIGNFDGVHLGHQAVLAQLRKAAQRHGLPATVVVFEPQPAEYFNAQLAPPRLTRLREKFARLSQLDIDRLLVLKFDHALASLPAPAFVRDLLIGQLGVMELVVGDNFRFGQGRAGNFALLGGLAATHGFVLTRADALYRDDERISSTRIRTLLASGEFAAAAALLGRSYRIGGRVVHGNAAGRAIGYPTININLQRLRTPLHGIFAVRVYGLAAAPVCGAAYIGSRPIADDSRDILEVHLFDYDSDCYGAYVEVEFTGKIRDAVPLLSLDALREQIALDTAAVKRALAGVGR